MRRAKWADVIVGVLLVLLLGTFTLAQIGGAEEIARRVKCASNLRQIGQAILLYANENKGAYPRTIFDVKNPAPTWGTPYDGSEKLGALPKEKVDPFDPKKSEVVPKPNDVTAALFMLLRTQDITSDVFICPSTGQTHFEYGGGANTPLNETNWFGRKSLAESLGYSFQNPYPSQTAIASGWKFNFTIGAEYAVAADMNPGTDALLKITPDSPAREMRKGNSPNHDFDGQNILYGDGHVEFNQNPFVGVKRDNIYTFGNSGTEVKDKARAGGEGIVGPPVGPDDSILLPTAKDLGIVNDKGELTEAAQKRRMNNGLAELQPGTPQQQAATKQAIQGTYGRAENNQKIVLTITADRISATQGPVTVAFSYQPQVIGVSAVRVVLTAPDTPPGTAMISVGKDDTITIKGNQFFQGRWHRQ